MSNRYLIWSEEHLAWWGRDPTNFNYTRSIQHARRYSKEEAAKIVANANRLLKPGTFPHEFVVAEPVDPEMRRNAGPAAWPVVDRGNDPEYWEF